MDTQWISLNITLKGQLIDMAGALLAELGCCGTLVEDRALDCFEVPAGDIDPLTDYTLTAYFEMPLSVDDLVAAVTQSLRSAPAFYGENIQVSSGIALATMDWAHGWKQHFSGFVVGERLLVRPSWEKTNPREGQIVIEIDPGMAFGTGTHATTQLCLEVIAELVPPGDSHGLRMLDVGTGSGILAIAAAALGCGKVAAIDIDREACEIARDNSAINAFSDRITVSDQPLEALEGSFDLVVANILAEENIRLKEALIARLSPQGYLVLSGILREKVEMVKTAFVHSHLVGVLERFQDDWACLVFQRR